MHIVSQLFMAAGKAGKRFDLGRFTKDSVYASDTIAQLTQHAAQTNNDALQGMVMLSMEVIAQATLAAPATPAPAPAPSAAIAAVPPAPAAQQYVDKLR